MTTDKQRLAEARALLERAMSPIVFARLDYGEQKRFALMEETMALEDDVSAWLAHDDEERDDVDSNPI